MAKIYTIQLETRDLFQALDGLEARAQAWEKTATYLRTDQCDEPFLIEECRDAEEAEQIAEHYRSIIRRIREQLQNTASSHPAPSAHEDRS